MGIADVVSNGAYHRLAASDIAEVPLVILMVSFYATAYAIGPAAVSTAIMEWLYRKRGLSPTAPKALILSMFLGLISGASIVTFPVLLAIIHDIRTQGISQTVPSGLSAALTAFALIGAVTGLLTGLIVRWAELRSQRHATAAKSPA
jgi:hypothetical protein